MERGVKVRRRKTIHFSIVFLLLIIICYCNWKFELIAFNPFFCGKSDGLKVLTWNIHCPEGADDIRQKERRLVREQYRRERKARMEKETELLAEIQHLT